MTKKNQSEDKQATDEEKKDSKFDSPTGKANTSVSQSSSIFESSTSHTPAKKIHFEFIQTFSLSRYPTTRNEFTGSFKSITSSVRHTGVYPADRLPWTRSTIIVANTDDHNRPGEHGIAFYIDEHGTGMYFDSYDLPPLDPRFLLRRNSIMYR